MPQNWQQLFQNDQYSVDSNVNLKSNKTSWALRFGGNNNLNCFPNVKSENVGLGEVNFFALGL